jgi:hypothetical protein
MAERHIECLSTEILIPTVSTILVSLHGQHGPYFYQAPIKARLSPSSFVIAFHPSSVLLEKLRLFNLEEVRAYVLTLAYNARLSSLDSAQCTNLDLSLTCPMILNLYEAVIECAGSEQRIMPMT